MTIKTIPLLPVRTLPRTVDRYVDSRFQNKKTMKLRPNLNDMQGTATHTEDDFSCSGAGPLQIQEQNIRETLLPQGNRNDKDKRNGTSSPWTLRVNIGKGKINTNWNLDCIGLTVL